VRIGSSLGRYRITSKIGEGGMGQVFQAEDDRLHRHVAIKILPPEWRGDPDRLARLEREAHALAQLEHPNVAAIYGLEESTPEGEVKAIPYLVMQYAEGDTLAGRLAHGPIPVDEAVAIGLQIASALEAAHDKGIVHRDLKPANIVLDADGKVKLLDFGLAKAFGTDSGSLPADIAASPTGVEGTRAGLILGTAGYMSPEQARGKTVDRRTDVWAFGCVMFEMLTGQATFPGETVTDVLGAIVRSDPDWTSLPANTPPSVRGLVERCLRKDITHRIQSIGDVRIALEEYKDRPAATAPAASAPSPRRKLAFVPWAIAAISLVGTPAVLLLRPPPPDPAVGRFSIALGSNPLRDSLASVALSNDGRQLAVVQTAGSTNTLLTIRAIDQLSSTPITGLPNLYNPFFSPDGKWIGFVSPTALFKAPATGGTPIQLVEVTRSRGATWTDTGEIIVAPTPASALARVSADGGQLVPLTTLDSTRGEVTHRWPQYVTGHNVVIFTAHNSIAEFDSASIDAFNLKTNQRKTLYKGGAFGRYLATGQLAFVTKGVVYAVPFDVDRLEVTGSPLPITPEIGYAPTEGAAQFAVSNTGLAVYRGGRVDTETFEALWVDQRGASEGLWDGSRTYAEPRISPDGTKVAFMVYADNDWDLWVYDRVRRVSTRLTFTPGIDGPGIWSPDSQYVAYSSGTLGQQLNLYRKRADGSGEAERLTATKTLEFVHSWSPDGKYLLYTLQGANGLDLYLLPLEGDRKPQAFLSTRFNETEGAFSPEGRWVAYESDESGRVEIYVRPLTGSGKWQISEGGGGHPRWSGDGRRLYYRDDDGVTAVPIGVKGDSIEIGRPERVIKGTFRGGVAGMTVGALRVADYDVARDGAHFVMFEAESKASDRIELLTVIVNWFTELKRLSPSRP
jgi:serine/threonine-protein kinase